MYNELVFYELDKAAEVDHVKFWYLVNKTRNCSNPTSGYDITFKGVSCKSNETILKGCDTYFNEFNSLDCYPNFDTQFKDYISAYVKIVYMTV